MILLVAFSSLAAAGTPWWGDQGFPPRQWIPESDAIGDPVSVTGSIARIDTVGQVDEQADGIVLDVGVSAVRTITTSQRFSDYQRGTTPPSAWTAMLFSTSGLCATLAANDALGPDPRAGPAAWGALALGTGVVGLVGFIHPKRQTSEATRPVSTSLSAAEPLPDMAVEVALPDGTTVGEAVTNASGRVQITLTFPADRPVPAAVRVRAAFAQAPGVSAGIDVDLRGAPGYLAQNHRILGALRASMATAIAAGDFAGAAALIPASGLGEADLAEARGDLTASVIGLVRSKAAAGDFEGARAVVIAAGMDGLVEQDIQTLGAPWAWSATDDEMKVAAAYCDVVPSFVDDGIARGDLKLINRVLGGSGHATYVPACAPILDKLSTGASRLLMHTGAEPAAETGDEKPAMAVFAVMPPDSPGARETQALVACAGAAGDLEHAVAFVDGELDKIGSIGPNDSVTITHDRFRGEVTPITITSPLVATCINSVRKRAAAGQAKATALALANAPPEVRYHAAEGAVLNSDADDAWAAAAERAGHDSAEPSSILQEIVVLHVLSADLGVDLGSFGENGRSARTEHSADMAIFCSWRAGLVAQHGKAAVSDAFRGWCRNDLQAKSEFLYELGVRGTEYDQAHRLMPVIPVESCEAALVTPTCR